MQKYKTGGVVFLLVACSLSSINFIYLHWDDRHILIWFWRKETSIV